MNCIDCYKKGCKICLHMYLPIGQPTYWLCHICRVKRLNLLSPFLKKPIELPKEITCKIEKCPSNPVNKFYSLCSIYNKNVN